MRAIPIGAKGVFETLVRQEDLANTFKDATLPPILATPVMIKFMENAALLAIQPYLEGNETALGTAVDVRHVAATPAGQRVSVEAEVIAVDGSRVTFTVRAEDGHQEIGRGTHERRIVDAVRFAQRLAAERKTNVS